MRVSHEKSETIKRNGRWVNVYGKNTPKAGKQLPGSGTFKTVGAATAAAGRRSRSFDKKGAPGRPNKKILKHKKHTHARKK